MDFKRNKDTRMHYIALGYLHLDKNSNKLFRIAQFYIKVLKKLKNERQIIWLINL
jgi:hypothetical protein